MYHFAANIMPAALLMILGHLQAQNDAGIHKQAEAALKLFS